MQHMRSVKDIPTHEMREGAKEMIHPKKRACDTIMRGCSTYSHANCGVTCGAGTECCCCCCSTCEAMRGWCWFSCSASEIVSCGWRCSIIWRWPCDCWAGCSACCCCWETSLDIVGGRIGVWVKWVMMWKFIGEFCVTRGLFILSTESKSSVVRSWESSAVIYRLWDAV